jgi:hypothetical protein
MRGGARGSRHLTCILTIAGLSILSGCAQSGGNASPRNRPAADAGPSPAAAASLSQTSPLSNTDPCAMRQHDICGAMLMYYFTNGRLPERLDELATMPGAEEPLQFVCPVTRTPYLYTTDGITIPERQTRIILYDPSPAHAGLRWAISIEEPQTGEPLVTKVLALPESFFIVRPPINP